MAPNGALIQANRGFATRAPGSALRAPLPFGVTRGIRYVDRLQLSEDTSPRAVINRSTGDFIFLDVDPGKYGLIAWEPLGSQPLNDPATGETLFIELPADKTTDIGEVYFP